ncbi:HipA-like C-terminal domain [Butyrivibrio fibrisolvens 16/4]|nr:HipA-like C-terminal domain [Butyrivibrio fibrisolvens 16/4]
MAMYTLMRKNEEIMMLQIGDDGNIVKLGKKSNTAILPLQNRTSPRGIIEWWRDRAIPIKQGKIEKMLRENGIETNGLYLTHNLGLSLTDYYWIRPIGSELTWEDVNLFDNDFKENLLLGKINYNDNEVEEYQPNSSLQGNLEKTWIIDNGIRKLVKGNHDIYSSESINEVIIGDAIVAQGRDAVTYSLLHIDGKNYDYGCISSLFTSQQKELVSAYAVMTSELKPNNISGYEHFINVCDKNGLDRNIVREYLEFEILIDFIFSNRDRHLTNISILRDADTLKFISMAPIYDSGKSMLVGRDIVPVTDKFVLSQESQGFREHELDLLKYVQNRKLIDVNLLPKVEYIEEMYHKDSQVSEERIKFVKEMYLRKIDMYERFANGENLSAIRF